MPTQQEVSHHYTEFIETAKVLRGWVGLDSRVSLHLGSAIAMPFADHVFDCAYMLHVGMNIVDKAKYPQHATVNAMIGSEAAMVPV